MPISQDDARLRLRWWLAKGEPIVRADAPAGWRPLLDELIEQGLAEEGADGVLYPLPHANTRRYTDDAAAAITRGMHLILRSLEVEGEVDSRTWFRRGKQVGISRDHLRLAYEWLSADGLIGPEGQATRPLIKVARPASAPKPAESATPPSPPTPEPTPAPPPAPKPPLEPEPARAETPVPVPEVSRPPTRAVRPRPTPKPATPVTLTTELLSRIAHAAEVQAQLTIAGASRVRTPLGVSPLLDCQRRIAVVLAAADGPMTAGQLGTGHLTRSQRLYRDAALVDGVAIGAFARAGGVFGRAVRYTLRDPEPLSSSWDEVHAAADALRRRREAG